MQLDSTACTFEALLRDRNSGAHGALQQSCSAAKQETHTQNSALVMFGIEELIIKKQSYTGSVFGDLIKHTFDLLNKISWKRLKV